MKTLYIDCKMGAAGDMLTAALLELLPDPDGFMAEVNALGIPDVKIRREPSAKCGINGTRVIVTVGGREESERMYEGPVHHHHGSMGDIKAIADKLPIPDRVKNHLMTVYGLIAEAESHVHKVPVTDIHFHEVGAMDAVADIVSVCLLMDRIAPDKVIVSPINVGGGTVRCAHGILPVPAPATLYILKGAPIYGGSIKSELCTPTGAALLRTFASEFGDMPVMKTEAVGYGMGEKDFDTANCVRVLLGTTEDGRDAVSELYCSIDDMTPEALGFAMDRLFEAGALEVYTVPIGMKKSRPGILLCAMCRNEDRDEFIKLLFKHTTTLGVRENISRRYILSRRIDKVQTPYGEIRKKTASGYGVVKEKYEYEDIARTAREQDVSLYEVTRSIESKKK